MPYYLKMSYLFKWSFYMKKSIKFNLLALLIGFSLNIWGMDGREEEEDTATSNNSNRRTEEQITAEEDLQKRLDRDHDLFFHSDRVTNLTNARIRTYDNASISGLRRWWDSIGNKGNITIASEAFNKGEDFTNFTEQERNAFDALDDNDKVTLIREY